MKSKYTTSTGESSSTHLITYSKKHNGLVRQNLTHVDIQLLILFVTRKSTMSSLINVSNNLHNTDVKLTGL